MSEEKYLIENNKLTFKSGKNLVFEYIIGNTLLVDNILIVILEAPPKVITNNNAYGVNMEGEIIWQIDKPPLFYEGKDCPFIDAIVNKQGQVVLFNWCDTALIIDPYTGEILDRYQTK